MFWPATFSLCTDGWQVHHIFLLFWFFSPNSKRTPSRQWSCATTSPCSAFIKRPSSSSSTCRSRPTFWGLLLTPRSKDTERWGRMCGKGEGGFHGGFPINTSFYLQMGQVWNELQPKLGCLFGSNNGVKSDIWDPDAPRGRGEMGRQWLSQTGK